MSGLFYYTGMVFWLLWLVCISVLMCLLSFDYLQKLKPINWLTNWVTLVYYGARSSSFSRVRLIKIILIAEEFLRTKDELSVKLLLNILKRRLAQLNSAKVS